MTEFDKLIQDNLKDGKAKTPSFVWDNIENEMEEEKRKKGIFFLFWPLGTLAILLSLGLLYWGTGGLSQQAYSEKNASEGSFSAKQQNQVLKPRNFGDFPTANYSKKDQTNLNKENSNTKEAYSSEILSTNSNSKRNAATGYSGVEENTENSNSKGNVATGYSGVEENTENSNSKGNVATGYSGVEENTENSNSKGNAATGFSGVEENTENSNSKENVDTGFSGVEENTENSNLKGNVATGFSGVEENTENSNLKENVATGFSGVEEHITGDSSKLLENKEVLLLLAEEVVVKKAQEKNKPKKIPFFIETKVGYSSYKMSLWNSSFVFGDLSNRKFRSSGVNASISFGYQISPWLNPMVGFNYNNKQAEFNYNALYDDEGYFSHNIQGNEMPLDEINDSDLLCNQFILYDIKAVFSITSLSLTVGNRFNLLQLKRIGIGIDLDLSYQLELISKVNVTSISKIDVSGNLTEMFNSKIAVGVNLNYQLSRQFRLFIHAEYIFKPYNLNNFHRSDTHELINSIGLRFNF
ncbi:MAG: hypothetical protein JKY03_09050 [Aureispira sp.]|nr:hypothetical protein [Aureispira sp.]